MMLNEDIRRGILTMLLYQREERLRKRFPAFSYGCGTIIYLTGKDKPLCACCTRKEEYRKESKGFPFDEGYAQECFECGEEVESTYGTCKNTLSIPKKWVK